MGCHASGCTIMPFRGLSYSHHSPSHACGSATLSDPPVSQPCFWVTRHSHAHMPMVHIKRQHPRAMHMRMYRLKVSASSHSTCNADVCGRADFRKSVGPSEPSNLYVRRFPRPRPDPNRTSQWPDLVLKDTYAYTGTGTAGSSLCSAQAWKTLPETLALVLALMMLAYVVCSISSAKPLTLPKKVRQ